MRNFYIFKCLNYYKLGFSKNVKERVKYINGCVPFKVELIFSHSSRQAFYVEKYWQYKYVDKYIKNEWFDLSQEDLKYTIENTRKISELEFLQKEYPSIYQNILKSRLYQQGLNIPDPKFLFSELEEIGIY